MTENPPAAAHRPWIVLLTVAVGVVATWLASATPRPAGADAPPSAFSAARAMVDVRAVAASPHPTGSAEIARARDHILSRLRAMGIPAETQSAEGIQASAKHKPGFVVAGSVTNVVGVLPGADRAAPAVLVMSHYDSLPNTPGAGDDAAGVAASLEIARILEADPDRKRDVIFLFTDGEEPGLLGVQAFLAGHPAARRLGVVINMEVRGDAGRTAMFETSRDSGALVRLFQARSPRPNANSLMAALYRVMPNDTDLTTVLEQGMAGLNFAFAGDQLAYHTSLSTPDHLDPGSLQDMGDQVLPVVQALARADALPAKAPDLTYSDLMGRLLVAYPGWVGWLLTAAAAGLTCVAVFLMRRDRRLAWGDLARGFGAPALILLATALGLHLCGRFLGGESPERVYVLVARYPLLLAGAAAVAAAIVAGVLGLMAAGARRWPLAVAVVLAGAACSLVGFDVAGAVVGLATAGLAVACLGRPTSAAGLWAGGLVFALVVGVVLQALVPAAAFLAHWPLLLAAGAAVIVLAFRLEPASPRGAAVLAAAGVAGIAQIGCWAGGFFLFMGPVVPEILALFAPLAALVLGPALYAACARQAGRRGALGLLVLGAGLLALTGLQDWPGASPRRLTQLFYMVDADARAYRRASATRSLDPWSRSALGEHPFKAKMPLVASGQIWLGPSAPVAVSGPEIVGAATPAGQASKVVLRVRPGPGGGQLKILIQPTKALRNLVLNGRPLNTLSEVAEYSLNRVAVVYSAPPADGVTIGFDAPPHGEVQVTALDFRDGPPAADKPLPPRPASFLTWGLSDATVVQRVLNYAW
ncbi:peptidase M20 [Caulobacter sp. CCUG 60055]|uniref:M20/M25/M40 family metallo-hydrolase n=1 Tax=Caulobacter sp. CCUG 60055 TaxID=2100090 RepID=UPI001FA6CA4A|nr:M20/M25/M40 family metallo-hydrolase [Caulobacter sp. CCUG 60055]MCI3179508.1 peptidase M20 [Caulobacter sp. CCUG 60055]